ncbi:MAG TPA: porin family protein, partial [Xanthobacteraceae bacterium]|nr:porin family protein [Xanthobacteraceae bacterium]
MMKKTIIAMAIATATGGGAVAADLPRGSAPYYPPPPDYKWTGPYAGLNLGYQWAKVTNNVTEPSGIAGGGQLGYNWQLSPFVFGVETDIQASAAADTFAPYKFSNPWFGTLRVRIG